MTDESEKPSNSGPNAPDHINDRARKMWRTIVRNFDLEDWQFELLRRLCETMTQVDTAEEQLRIHGLVYEDRWEQPHPRPEVSIMRQGIVLTKQLLRELYLDADAEDLPV